MNMKNVDYEEYENMKNVNFEEYEDMKSVNLAKLAEVTYYSITALFIFQNYVCIRKTQSCMEHFSFLPTKLVQDLPGIII